MQLSLFDVLIITLVSMGVVFVILLGIMFLMMLTSKIVGILEKAQPQKEVSQVLEKTQETVKLSGQDLFMQDPSAKVAVLTALAHASQSENKNYKIESVEKVR